MPMEKRGKAWPGRARSGMARYGKARNKGEMLMN